MLNIDVVLRKIRILIVTFYSLWGQLSYHEKFASLYKDKKDLNEKEDFKT